MTERFPDIEIYLMKASADDVSSWLGQHIRDLSEQKAAADRTTVHWRSEAAAMDIFFNANAEKNFASVWFKQNQTPWLNDLECARSAHQQLGCEVRCSDSSWDESSDEESGGEGWIKLIRGEEKAFIWK